MFKLARPTASYALAAVLALVAAHPGVADTVSPTVQVDNDLFTPGNGDRDYTGGISISALLEGRPGAWHPDRVLGGLPLRQADGEHRRSLQLRVLAFTPGDLSRSGVDRGDRPCASLWSVTGARLTVHADGSASDFAAVTVGVLGLPATASLHRAIHEATGAIAPAGYTHQVSAGGEPTARIGLAHRRRLHGGAPQHGSDLWITFAGSLGFLTEASIAIAGRHASAANPWWLSNADLADYGAAPTFGGSGPGLEFEYGVKLRVRLYNAFLQGQWRHSDHTLDARQVSAAIGEAWLGTNFSLRNGWRLGARLSAQTGEARQGPAAQNHVWGSIALARQW